MKYIIILGIMLVALSACNTTTVQEAPGKSPIVTAPNEPAGSIDDSTGQPTDEMEETHIGCQEGEIDDNGNCIPADVNNAAMFDKDVDDLVTTESVSGAVNGFLAQPAEEGSYPGVVMIHEWWGLNDNIKDMAKILASEGYVVFAIDLYDGEVATTSDEAMVLATAVRNNPDEAVDKLKAAVSYLKENEDVSKVASLGWCFGGQQSLALSLNDQLDATVIYYGSLIDDKEQLANIDWPVLGIFGEEDTSIPVSSVASFESALDDLGIENQVYIYPGVGHAFANPSGSNYAASETEDAWDKTLSFLETNLKSEDNMDVKVFVVDGSNYKFTMDGVDAPEIRVNEGDRVRIEFTSVEGFHDWVVDEFDAATGRVQAGGSTSVEFVADQKGTFEYYCSVGSHRANGMVGNLVVE